MKGITLSPPEWIAPIRWAFAALLLAIGFSIAGTAALYHVPGTAASVGPHLAFLMLAPTWVYLVGIPIIVFLIYLPSLGPRRSTVFLAWGVLVGLVAELIGTSTGYPFGTYSYTEFLQPQVLGDVPVVIPFSWYATAVLALDLASRIGGSARRRIVMTGVFMALWDLALDPAMSLAFPVWTWQVDGFLYGMPAINIVGWFATGIVIAWGYEALGGGIVGPAIPGVRRLWILSAALPLGLAAVRGMGTAVGLGILAIAIPLLAPNVGEPRRAGAEHRPRPGSRPRGSRHVTTGSNGGR